MGKKKDNYAVSEYRDSSDMNEGKYICASPKTHDWCTVADLGAPDMDLDTVVDLGPPDMDIDPDMALYVDERISERIPRIGERVEEDGREGGEGKDEREEPQEAEGEEAAELVDNEEANVFNSDQSWNWWSKEIPDETVKVKERKEHANAGYKESVADRLLAAWTTVKPVT